MGCKLHCKSILSFFFYYLFVCFYITEVGTARLQVINDHPAAFDTLVRIVKSKFVQSLMGQVLKIRNEENLLLTLEVL